MKEKEVKVKKYECENCGATYNSSTKYKISTCPITDKEICPKCSIIVQLYNPEKEHYENTRVHPSAVSDGYVLHDTEYYEAVENIKYEFCKKIEELNKDYLSNNMKKCIEFFLT